MSESEASSIEPAETVAEESPAQETDWKVEARKWESRAKENLARATANNDAAERLAKIEEANKSEAEKAEARAEAAEKRAAELEVKALRAEVANAKGVPASLLSGSTQEELEAAADALIEFRGEQKQAPKSDALGRVNKTTVKGTTGDVFADFFTKNLT